MDEKATFLSQATDKIVTKSATFRWHNPKIMRIDLKEGADIDLEESINNFFAAKILSGGKPCLKLVDARVRWSISNEAREFAAKKETKTNTIARAVLVDSLASRLIVNFFIRFNKPQSPVRLFTSEEKALDWLNNIAKQEGHAE